MSIKKPTQSDVIASEKNNMSDEDARFFRDAVTDVRPLKHQERMVPLKKKPPPRLRSDSDDDHRAESETMSDPVHLADVEIGDELFFARAGIQLKVQKKLRRGEFAIGDELDLHGYTVVEAKRAISEFIDQCKQDHIRCIRIIHGKGYRSESKIPILKTYVAHWLPQHSDVMAFSSARPADGSTGALYVLLKKLR